MLQNMPLVVLISPVSKGILIFLNYLILQYHAEIYLQIVRILASFPTFDRILDCYANSKNY